MSTVETKHSDRFSDKTALVTERFRMRHPPSWMAETFLGLPTRRSRFLAARFWCFFGLVSLFALLLVIDGRKAGAVSSSIWPYVDIFRPHRPYDAKVTIGRYNLADALKKAPAWELTPFPEAPMVEFSEDDSDNDRQNPWLGAVLSSAWDLQRRALIRWTWMKYYKDVPMDKRFVLSHPGPDWIEYVQQENQTFGDLIVLDHVEENRFTSKSIKTVEFYRWLSERSPRKYQFVSKFDDKLFVNARTMWEDLILPRLEQTPEGLKATVNNTYMGQFYYDKKFQTVFPHASAYTVTWDVVELLPQLRDQFDRIVATEDMYNTWIMMKAERKANFVLLNHEQMYSFDPKDTRPGREDTAWARSDSDPTSSSHAVASKDTMAVGWLKTDEQMLMVANCFDENGIKDAPRDTKAGASVLKNKPKYPIALHKTIPDELWEVDVDGGWVCNGVWKLEPGADRPER